MLRILLRAKKNKRIWIQIRSITQLLFLLILFWFQAEIKLETKSL